MTNGKNRFSCEAELKIIFKGKGASPESIEIEIGLGPSSEDQVVFEDQAEHIRVVIHPARGMKAYENHLEIIKQDPNYAFLFETPIDKGKLIELVKSRTNLLQSDWDKPQAVFSSNQTEVPAKEVLAIKKE